MQQLDTEHPAVLQEFLAGNFSVQMSSTNSFGRIPMDQAIEETVNKDTQTAGGTKGFSTNIGAVSKFYINADHRSNCIRQMRAMLKSHMQKYSHPDLSPSRINKDERDVESIIDMLHDSWVNLFAEAETSEIVVCLSTGQSAPPDVNKTLLGAAEMGEVAYSEFKTNRLETSSHIEFFKPLKRLRLKTFSDVNKKKKLLKQTTRILF
jgi:hypothetical protein